MLELYAFQKETVAQLRGDRHIVVAQMGCLAKGTPIRMADGTVKPVEEISNGEYVMAFDQETGEIKPNAVANIIMTCDCPKPMIELEYDGERITTTYDHYFYTGHGFAPLYQLVWGKMEASQRAKLQLLCKRYGQDCDYKFFWEKHSKDNEPRKRQVWLLQDSDGRENGKGPQDYCGDLVKKSFRLATDKSPRLQPEQQQSGKSGMVFEEIQCLLWGSQWEHKGAEDIQELPEGTHSSRTKTDTGILYKEYGGEDNPGEKQTLRHSVREIPKSLTPTNTKIRKWTIRIKAAAPYYTICMREAPYTYCVGRRHTYITHNSGKNPMSMVWGARRCKETGKNKILVVTTASKSRTGEHAEDLERFTTPQEHEGITITTISWHKLRAWVDAHRLADIDEYVYVLDELQRAGAGTSSGMGRAFLSITRKTKDWSGWTGTPGDTWLKFYPYFTACGLVKNKTQFMNRYACVQTYKGYPEIIGWRHEEELKDMWARISYAPDTRRVLQELPKETHRVFTFVKPRGYSKTLKTRLNADGEFLDTAGALCSELRRLCFTNNKKQWVADFVDGLDSGCVFFYNFVKTGDELEKIIQKALPKGAKVWRVDGKHHDIPTAETIGPKDMVLCQWQSGAEALNLQFLHYWCSVEACYSYSTSVQARGRIKRIGQEHPMYFAYLRTEDTIEDDVYKALATKSEFSQKNWCITNNIIEKGEKDEETN